MSLNKVFSSQTAQGQVPALMFNRQEGARKWVDTLAITMVAVYLAQLHQNWRALWGTDIEKALDFIEGKAYEHEVEGFKVWHFNGFYPPDWEDTSFAVFLLVKNGKLDIGQLNTLRELLLRNTTEQGTGVWVKDFYSPDNVQQNYWDPTSTLNILRLHYLLESDVKQRRCAENFINDSLSLEQFGKTTLYYTPPVAAFFAKRLVSDFPDLATPILYRVEAFHQEVIKAVSQELLRATSFERALLGLPSREQGNGFIFHHGRRTQVWYGSPVLHKLARAVIIT